MILCVHAYLLNQKLCFHSLLRGGCMVHGVNKLSFRYFHWIIFIHSTNWVIWPEPLLYIASDDLYLSIHRNHTLCSSILLLSLMAHSLQLHSADSHQHDETFVLQLMANQLDHREYIEQTRYCVHLSIWIGAKKYQNNEMELKRNVKCEEYLVLYWVTIFCWLVWWMVLWVSW